MYGDDDAKYSKMKKQRQRTLFVVAMLALPFLIGIFLVLNRSSQSGARAPRELIRQGNSLALSEAKTYDFDELRRQIEVADAEVRNIRQNVKIFETDKEGQIAAKKLQDVTRTFLKAYYGPQEPYRVKVDLEFQDTIADFAEKGADGMIMIELAPSSLQPHSIHTFLELARTFHGGAFHRIAPHVLQTTMSTKIKHLAFQEYSDKFPHKLATVGYAGRPSGPAWYVSTQDNARNHGPGSQQQANPYEADSCFGKVIEGFDDHVQRIRTVTSSEGKKWPQFLGDKKRWVKITSMTILVPDEHGDYDEWQGPDAEST